MSAERAEFTLDWAELIEAALTLPGSIGNEYSRFHNYSFLNTCLMRMQGMEGPVATYDRWRSLGRQVLKGSKAKVIVRPIVVQRKNDETGDVEATFTRFKPVKCLFDYNETEGEELPPYEIPEWIKQRALEQLDIREVPFAELNGNVAGYSRGREFALNPMAVHPAKPMFHELSHIVSGHTVAEKIMEYAAHRGVFEFEAEGAAHLVMNELGALDDVQASSSRAYLQEWPQGERPPDTSIKRVFTSTDQNSSSRPSGDRASGGCVVERPTFEEQIASLTLEELELVYIAGCRDHAELMAQLDLVGELMRQRRLEQRQFDQRDQNSRSALSNR